MVTRSCAKLHIVEQPATAPAKPVEPERALSRLFARERKLEAEMAKVRASIGFERARYAAKHRLACFPNIDTLRRVLG